jgi:membrane-bound inhibitor of C-type lysozyme
MSNLLSLAAPALALLLAGCACGLDAPAPAPAPVAYACDDGTTFTADFDPLGHRVTVERPSAAPMVMAQTVSGSGVRYRNGEHVFHTKGRGAFWVTGGTRLVGCREMRNG